MILSNNSLHSDPYFIDPTEDLEVLKDRTSVDLFDQNGYHLTKAEQAFLVRNGYRHMERRHEDCMRYDWFTSNKREGAHINHSDLFERKGFSSVAKDQLTYVAEEYNPMLYKLIKMKPKWGIDISIDFVSKDAVFEVFHYEWDSFNFEKISEKKLELEQFILNLDWDDAAKKLWRKRNEWYNLDFFEQTQWRTDYFGLSPEKFKNAIWDN